MKKLLFGFIVMLGACTSTTVPAETTVDTVDTTVDTVVVDTIALDSIA